MKKALYLILILIALGLGYLRLQPPTLPDDSAGLASPSPSALALNYQLLDTPTFSLEYPREATVSSFSSPDSNTWAVSYMGATQRSSGRTQTELFDGYSLGITLFEAIGENLDLNQAKTDRQGIIDACGLENVTELKADQLDRYPTLSFFGGCLGEATHHYFLQQDKLYRLTLSIVGPEESKKIYQKTLDDILKTVQFK